MELYLKNLIDQSLGAAFTYGALSATGRDTKEAKIQYDQSVSKLKDAIEQEVFKNLLQQIK